MSSGSRSEGIENPPAFGWWVFSFSDQTAWMRTIGQSAVRCRRLCIAWCLDSTRRLWLRRRQNEGIFGGEVLAEGPGQAGHKAVPGTGGGGDRNVDRRG